MANPLAALLGLQPPSPVLDEQGNPVPSDPASAAATLSAGPQRANDPLALFLARQQHESEIKDRLINNPAGFGNSTDAYNRARDTGLLQDVQGDMNEDPSTGTAARAAQAKTAQSVNDAATFNRPDVAGVRQQQNQDALAKILAPIQAQSQAALALNKQQGEVTPREVADAAAKQEIARTVAQSRTDVADTKAGGAGSAAGDKVPPQAANAAIMATQGRQMIPQVLQQIDSLGSIIGPVQGRIGNWLIDKAGSDATFSSPQQAGQFAGLKTAFKLLSAKMASTVTARGMNKSVMDDFHADIGAAKDPSILKGVLAQWDSFLAETQKGGTPGYVRDAMANALTPTPTPTPSGFSFTVK
jgi:hypothetical protein